MSDSDFSGSGDQATRALSFEKKAGSDNGYYGKPPESDSEAVSNSPTPAHIRHLTGATFCGAPPRANDLSHRDAKTPARLALAMLPICPICRSVYLKGGER